MPRITQYGVKAALSAKLRDLPLGDLGMLALMLDSEVADGNSEDHAWLGSSPSMREWIRRRLQHQPHAFDFAIKNKLFEVSGDMPLRLLETDKTGEAQSWIDDFVAAYPLWIEERIASLIDNAGTLKSFDGQAFFSGAHSFANSGIFDNDITYNAATPSAVTTEEAALAINKAIETLRGFPDDHGRAILNNGMNAVDVLIKPGTDNAGALRLAITADMVNTGSGSIDNPLRGQDVDVRPVSAGLTSLANTEFVVARSRRMGDSRAKPFLFQENRTMRRIDVLGEGSDHVVKENAVGIFIKTVGDAGYGHPGHAVRVTFN